MASCVSTPKGQVCTLSPEESDDLDERIMLRLAGLGIGNIVRVRKVHVIVPGADDEAPLTTRLVVPGGPTPDCSKDPPKPSGKGGRARDGDFVRVFKRNDPHCWGAWVHCVQCGGSAAGCLDEFWDCMGYPRGDDRAWPHPAAVAPTPDPTVVRRTIGPSVQPDDEQQVYRVVFGTDAQEPFVLDWGPVGYVPSGGRGKQLAPDSREFLLALLAYYDWARGIPHALAWGDVATTHSLAWSGFDYFETEHWRASSGTPPTLDSADVLRVWLRRLGVAAAVEAVDDYPWSIASLQAAHFHQLYDPTVSMITGEASASLFSTNPNAGTPTVAPQTSLQLLRSGRDGTNSGVVATLTDPKTKTQTLVSGASAQWLWNVDSGGFTTGVLWDTNPKVAADRARLALDRYAALGERDSPFTAERVEPARTSAAQGPDLGHVQALRAVTAYLIDQGMANRFKKQESAAKEGFASSAPAGADSSLKKLFGGASLQEAIDGFGNTYWQRPMKSQVVLSLLRAMNVPVRLAKLPYLNHQRQLVAMLQTTGCEGGAAIKHPGVIIQTSPPKNVAAGWSLVAPTVGRMLTVAGLFTDDAAVPYVQDTLAHWFGLSGQRYVQDLISQLDKWTLASAQPGAPITSDVSLSAVLRLASTEADSLALSREIVRSFCNVGTKRWPILVDQVKDGWAAWASGGNGVESAEVRLGKGGAEQRIAIREFFEIGSGRVLDSDKVKGTVHLVPTDAYAPTALGSAAVTGTESWDSLMGKTIALSPRSQGTSDESGPGSISIVPSTVEASASWLDCDAELPNYLSTFALAVKP